MNQGLADSVAARARLESLEEAASVIREVAAALAEQTPAEAWEVLAHVLPDPERRGGDRRSAPSASDLFEDVGHRLDLGAASAARYTRVVAEAVDERLSSEQRTELERLLDDELLALFEEERGEHTEAGEGAHRADPGPTTRRG